MVLELSREETRELKNTLDAALQTMLNELAHTDQRAFRRDLRARYEQLEAVRRRLDLSLEGDPLYA